MAKSQTVKYRQYREFRQSDKSEIEKYHSECWATGVPCFWIEVRRTRADVHWDTEGIPGDLHRFFHEEREKRIFDQVWGGVNFIAESAPHLAFSLSTGVIFNLPVDRARLAVRAISRLIGREITRARRIAKYVR